MKVHKLAFLISVVLLPTHVLSAESNTKSMTLKSTVIMPTQAGGAREAVSPVNTPTKVSPSATLNTPVKSVTAERPIKLSSTQQLYLANGQSIVRVNNTGLNVLGVNGKVQSTYNHSTLFEGSNRNVWINTNTTKIKLGVFSRIQTKATVLNIKGAVGGFTPPQPSATVGSALNPASSKVDNKPTVGSKTQKFVYGADLVSNNSGGEENPQESGFEREVKGEAQVFENIEVQPNYREFTQFNVTSDSVVATATVVVDEDHRSLTLVWGDGSFEYVTLTGLRSTITSKNRTSDPTKFKFQHIYKAPFDQSNKTVKILAKDSNGKGVSASSTEVNINPRYTFILYPVQLEINEHLDSISETHSELYVYMNVMHNNQLRVGKEWNESIKTGPGAGEGMFYPVHYSLGDGSRLQLDMTYQDEPVQVYFDVKEKDNWVKSIWDVVSNIPAGFDTSNQSTYMPSIHPKDFTGSKEFRKRYTLSDDGSVTVVMSTELNLIVPSILSDGENSRLNNSMAR